MASKPKMHVVFALGMHLTGADAEHAIKVIDKVKPHAVLIESAMASAHDARKVEDSIKIVQRQLSKLKSSKARKLALERACYGLTGFQRRLYGKALEKNIPVFCMERHEGETKENLDRANLLSSDYFTRGVDAFLDGKPAKSFKAFKAAAKLEKAVVAVRDAGTLKTLEAVRDELARLKPGQARKGFKVVAVAGVAHTRPFLNLRRFPVEGITTERVFPAQPMIGFDRTSWFARNVDELPKEYFFRRIAVEFLLYPLTAREERSEKGFAAAALLSQRLKPEHFAALSRAAAVGGGSREQRINRFFDKFEELTQQRIPRTGKQLDAFIKRRLPRAKFEPRKG